MQHKQSAGLAGKSPTEMQLNSYDELVRRARAERSAVIGEMISTAIARTWFSVKRLAIPMAGRTLKFLDRAAEHLATAR
jgi:hypothetical protein